jgi:uncharacterized integral membrane protein
MITTFMDVALLHIHSKAQSRSNFTHSNTDLVLTSYVDRLVWSCLDYTDIIGGTSRTIQPVCWKNWLCFMVCLLPDPWLTNMKPFLVKAAVAPILISLMMTLRRGCLASPLGQGFG